MSNESNREPSRTVSPGDLQASDFFPPGHGWNKDETPARRDSAGRECVEDEAARDGGRQH
jgi:hypothetical protein